MGISPQGPIGGDAFKNGVSNIDKNLSDILAGAQKGQVDLSKIFQAKFDLQSLLKNPGIPDDVKSKLQDALSQLSSMPDGKVDLSSLMRAKFDLDQIK